MASQTALVWIEFEQCGFVGRKSCSQYRPECDNVVVRYSLTLGRLRQYRLLPHQAIGLGAPRTIIASPSVYPVYLYPDRRKRSRARQTFLYSGLDFLSLEFECIVTTYHVTVSMVLSNQRDAASHMARKFKYMPA